MPDDVAEQLAKWSMPAIIAALLTVLISMSAFLLSKATKNGENIAVISQMVSDGKALREKAYEINTSEHKQIFAQLTSLVSQQELNVRLAEVRAQIALLEAAVKQLDVQVASLKVELTALQIQVRSIDGERKK